MKDSPEISIRKIVIYIDRNAYVIAKLIAFCFSVAFLVDWIHNDNSPVAFLVFLVVCFYFPLLRIVMTIIMFFVKLVCQIYLMFAGYHHTAESDYSYQEEYDGYRDENQNHQDNSNSSQNNRSYQQNSNSSGSRQGYSSNGSSAGAQKSDLDIALAFYNLRIPYTEKELKERRKYLIKKAHPDSGGSEEDAKKINAYFDILKKYIS